MLIPRFITRLLYLLLLAAPLAAQAAAPSLVGDWQGALSVGGTDIPLIVHLRQQPDGRYTGTLDSPKQQAYGLPITSISQRADSVTLQLTAPAARFVSRLSADGQQLDGAWQQGGQAAPLRLTRQAAGSVSSGRRPQTPQPPFPYRSQDVSFANAGANIKLGGTLTIPPGKGPFPALIMVTGSGAQDRDETILGHKPFLVLADYLTHRGYVVLRYDDRGVGQSGGDRTNYTTADGVTDAQAALAYLRQRPEVRAGQVGLLGHSEGAMVGLLAATQASPPDFLISLAGPAVRGVEMMVRQNEDLGRAAGLPAEQLTATKALNQQIYLTVLQTPDNQQAQAQVVALFRQAGLNAAQAQQQAVGLTTAWYRQLLAFDPQPLLPKVKCPVLALNGSKDLQVAASQNLPALEKGIRSGGNADVTAQELPGLNHLFQTAPTGQPQEYGQLEETFAPSALAVIGDWLARHHKAK